MLKGIALPSALASCALLLMSGCATFRGPNQATPGEGAKASPERVWAELGCASRPLPFVLLDSAELIPDTVKPGGSFSHRIVYSLCSADGAPVAGRLRRRILRRSTVVLADTTPGYRLKPGRWAVDAVITVPANAPEGPYQVVVDFAGPVTFNRPVGLNVKR